MEKIIWKLGWRYIKVRIVWYKLTHRWLWGIAGALQTPDLFRGKIIDDTDIKELDEIFLK